MKDNPTSDNKEIELWYIRELCARYHGMEKWSSADPANTPDRDFKDKEFDKWSSNNALSSWSAVTFMTRITSIYPFHSAGDRTEERVIK